MASRDANERDFEKAVATGLRGWLAKARSAVMAPFTQHHMLPDPVAVYSTQQDWTKEVDTIVTKIGRIAEGAWNEVAGMSQVSVSRHAFAMSQLAQTQNFLARVPDDVYNLIFAEIADALNAGASVDQVGQKVDQALNWTGTENWPNRARVIARTEVTRAMNAGVQGAAGEMSRISGKVLTKTWRAHHDEKTRVAHHAADGQTVPFYQPFMVGGEPLQFPGDPMGSADNVINCRCDMVVRGDARG